MSNQKFSLVARVTTQNLEAVERVLQELSAKGAVTRSEEGFVIEAELSGSSARDLNRMLLAGLRRIERKTTLRAEWTSSGMTERFFDYIPKGAHKA